MLIKLLKHEFRATARIMGPLYLILLAVALGFNFSARLMDTSNVVLNVLAALVILAYVAAIIGVFIVSFILMLQRFYKNLLGDEGYIMFTLPASVHQQTALRTLKHEAGVVVPQCIGRSRAENDKSVHEAPPRLLLLHHTRRRRQRQGGKGAGRGSGPRPQGEKGGLVAPCRATAPPSFVRRHRRSAAVSGPDGVVSPERRLFHGSARSSHAWEIRLTFARDAGKHTFF